MKRAVAQLEKYLDKIEGYTKGTVVLATVFGDVHDIGKSLVNTILTNNGYTVVDLGKQVPIGTILDAAKEHDADGDRPLRAARLDLQADAAGRPGAARARPRVPGADRRRRDQPQLRPPHPLPERQGVRRDLRARRLLLQGRVRGPGRDGPARRGRRSATRSSTKIRDEARKLREKGPEPEARPDRRRLRPLRRAHRRRRPRAAVLGRARDRRRPRRRLPPPRHPRAVQAALGRPRREGRGLAASWSTRTSARGWSACGREQDYLHPRALLGYFPCNCGRQRADRLRPRGPRAACSSGSSSRASPSTTASASPTSTARRTAASATSSRSRPSPPATRSPS